MKKLLFILVACTMLYSCSDPYKSNLDKMTNKSEQYLLDLAFKINAELKILELLPINYDTIPETYLDTMRLSFHNEKMTHFGKLADNYLNQAKLELRQAKLYSSLGWKDLAEMNKEDFKENLENGRIYNDSVLYHFQQDSLIRVRLEQNKANNNVFYRYKFYLKAQHSDIANTKKKANIADTLYYYFDTNLNKIEL